MSDSELIVEYKGQKINLYDYDGQTFNWQGDLVLAGRDLDNDHIPDLSKFTVRGDFDISHNRLNNFQKLPKTVCGSFYANFNLIDNLDGFPQYVGGSCDMIGNRLRSKAEELSDKIGDGFIMTDDAYYAWRDANMMRVAGMILSASAEEVYAEQDKVQARDPFMTDSRRVMQRAKAEEILAELEKAKRPQKSKVKLTAGGKIKMPAKSWAERHMERDTKFETPEEPVHPYEAEPVQVSHHKDTNIPGWQRRLRQSKGRRR